MFELNQVVIAVYGAGMGGRRGFRGHISEIHDDDHYTVVFDDSDVEIVHASNITAAKKKLWNNTSPEEHRKRKK